MLPKNGFNSLSLQLFPSYVSDFLICLSFVFKGKIQFYVLFKAAFGKLSSGTMTVGNVFLKKILTEVVMVHNFLRVVKKPEQKDDVAS